MDSTRFFFSFRVLNVTCGLSYVDSVNCTGVLPSARGGNQDSLMRQLLSVELLQPPCMNLLLEKLAEFTGDEE